MNNLEEKPVMEINNQLPEPEVEQPQLDEGIPEEELPGDTYPEQLLRALVKSYEDAYNRHNPKYEIKYYLTITNHKLAMKDGNKDIAYFRLERAIRSKEVKIEDPKVEGLQVPEWSHQLVHQEMHIFKSMAERVNPKAPWKEQLYLNSITRLISAGLEYAELLQRMKATNLKEMKEQEEKKLDLVITDKMPKAMTDDELKYQEWVKANNVNAK